MTNPFHIELTPDERALLDQIELDALALRDQAHWQSNSDLVVALYRSLSEREAIPEHRWKVFADASYNIGGRGSSVLDHFKRNGNQGEEIIRHPHFLKHLKFFLFGPDLPASVLAAFKQEVDNCFGHVTSSDVPKLSAAASRIARAHRLEPREASEEFFKLGLEHGLGPSYAVFLRDKVRAIRYTR
ncbi:MAG: hypothetical protein KA105_06565 [Caulobacter sp.]|jgi:hypothetical protein|nr:hypothetical protein [Caulobacter sp.]